MRTMIALALFAAGIAAQHTPADSAEAAKKRTAKSRAHAAQPRVYLRDEMECERARHEDPTGLYAGYPCWAREAFAKSNRNDQ